MEGSDLCDQQVKMNSLVMLLFSFMSGKVVAFLPRAFCLYYQQALTLTRPPKHTHAHAHTHFHSLKVIMMSSLVTLLILVLMFFSFFSFLSPFTLSAGYTMPL